MRRAIKRVIKNKGAPGVDGMTVLKIEKYYNKHRDKIEKALLERTYMPTPVLQKEIPKPNGGVRLLGIPIVLDRVIQQAVAQILTSIWDHTFSENSFGFRPKRSQHGAMRRYRELKVYMNGWWNYYGLTESYNRLKPLDHWIRRRLRTIIWKHWKNRRTRVGELIKRGVHKEDALKTGCARKGPWRMSRVLWVQMTLPDKYFSSLGLVFPWN